MMRRVGVGGSGEAVDLSTAPIMEGSRAGEKTLRQIPVSETPTSAITHTSARTERERASERERARGGAEGEAQGRDGKE